MYTRQPSDDRYYRGIRIPNEYHGNAFRNEIQKDDTEDDTPPILENDGHEPTATDEKETKPEAKSASASPLLGGLFGNKGAIGFEELLIIAIAFIVSQSEDKDDLAFLLLLLLFIK